MKSKRWWSFERSNEPRGLFLVTLHFYDNVFLLRKISFDFLPYTHRESPSRA